jgi:uncharacterized protein (TIGR02270 family)
MSPQQTAAEPFRDLVDESFDEAAFLWRRWESELASPTRNLDEIYSWTEDRLHGALDGIRVGGAAAIETATAALGSDEIDRVTVGAGVLASSADSGATDALAAALKEAKGEKLRAMVRALELLGSDHALRAAASVLVSAGPEHAGALCRLKAFRRVAPGNEIVEALKADAPDAQVDAVRAARLVPSAVDSKWLSAALQNGAPAVQYAAVETGMCLRNSQAWETAIALARKGASDSGAYLNLIALFGTAEEHEIVYKALRIPGLQAPAVWALGHIGTARAADACLAGMKHYALARACGEAYCWITGADLERDRLAAPETPAESPAFEDDDLDANLVPPPEALWPLPDPEAARKHWLALSSDWTPDVRYVRGRPVNGETLLATIETGPMLRRPDLVLELRVKTRGRYDVETRAFTARQRQMMTAARAAAVNHSER